MKKNLVKQITLGIVIGTMLMGSSAAYAAVPEGSADGDNSIAIGTGSLANGENSIAIGFASASNGSVQASKALGDESIAIGTGSSANAERGIALGYRSAVTGSDSVALGVGSVAHESDVVSVGSGGAAGVPATAPAYRKIVNVADGVNDHDAVTVGQLNKALEGVSAGGSVDLTGYAKTADVNAALDTKANVSDVYTKTEVDTALAVKADAAEVNAALDTKANVSDVYTKTEVDNTYATKTEVDNTYATKTEVSAKANASDVYTKREVDNLISAGGNVDLTDYAKTDDVYTKDQVAEHVDNVTDHVNRVADNLTKLNGEVEDGFAELNNQIGITNGYVVGNMQDISALEDKTDTMQEDLSALNAEVVKTNDHFNAELQKTNDHFNTELGKTNQQVVANAQGIAANSSAITGLDQRVTSLDGRVDKVGAGAAALAALHPLDYDSENKLSFAAGVGNYAGSTAAAVGAFYRPNEDVMFSIGGTAGNGENMVNLGASFAIGKGSSGVAKLSKAELVTAIKDVKAENSELRHEINNAKAENQKLQDRIAKLEAMVLKLAGK